MKTVIGVDGCPGGWIAVIWGETPEYRLLPDFAAVLALTGDIIAVDMPIGFLTTTSTGGRLAERDLRKFLGTEKGRSVFPSPARATVEANPIDHQTACRINRAHSNPPKGMSIQCFSILKKMREIDELMTLEMQNRVFECHPEACFAMMSGGAPILASKKTAEGHKQRETALAKCNFPIKHLPVSNYPWKEVGPDDLLDACACAWTARRILEKRSTRFPPDPPRDAKGLRMEINA